MKNSNFIRTMLWALVPLVIPLLGNQFVDGWNWTWHDFLFAWVFLGVASLIFQLFRSRVHGKMHKNLVGVGVVLGFAAIWAMLATG